MAAIVVVPAGDAGADGLANAAVFDVFPPARNRKHCQRPMRGKQISA
jgi:hypothetical protein